MRVVFRTHSRCCAHCLHAHTHTRVRCVRNTTALGEDTPPPVFTVSLDDPTTMSSKRSRPTAMITDIPEDNLATLASAVDGDGLVYDEGCADARFTHDRQRRYLMVECADQTFAACSACALDTLTGAVLMHDHLCANGYPVNGAESECSRCGLHTDEGSCEENCGVMGHWDARCSACNGQVDTLDGDDTYFHHNPDFCRLCRGHCTTEEAVARCTGCRAPLVCTVTAPA